MIMVKSGVGIPHYVCLKGKLTHLYYQANISTCYYINLIYLILYIFAYRSEMIVHSGCTQEYWSNRIDLTDHAEDILSFEFGVRSLLRISLECIVDNTPNYFTKSQLSELPIHLYDMLYKRIYNNNDELYHYNISPPSTTDPLLNRKHVLHAGI